LQQQDHDTISDTLSRSLSHHCHTLALFQDQVDSSLIEERYNDDYELNLIELLVEADVYIIESKDVNF